MNSGWGWGAKSAATDLRNRAGWISQLIAAAPWITLGVLLLMMHLMGRTITMERGTLFELPDETGLSDGAKTSLVALVLPMPRETLVFFDDARYVLDDPQSMESFGQQVAERAEKLRESTLLVLADRRISAGELMNLAATVKRKGLDRILFAEKRTEAAEE